MEGKSVNRSEARAAPKSRGRGKKEEEKLLCKVALSDPHKVGGGGGVAKRFSLVLGYSVVLWHFSLHVSVMEDQRKMFEGCFQCYKARVSRFLTEAKLWAVGKSLFAEFM